MRSNPELIEAVVMAMFPVGFLLAAALTGSFLAFLAFCLYYWIWRITICVMK